MKVKVLKNIKFDDTGIHKAGEEVDIPKEAAEQLLASGAVCTLAAASEKTKEKAAAKKDKLEEGEIDRETGLPVWPYKLTPIAYIDRFDADAPGTKLAHLYIDADLGQHTASV